MASRLLAAVCLFPPDGHDKALEAITECGLLNGVERFAPLVQGKDCHVDERTKNYLSQVC